MAALLRLLSHHYHHLRDPWRGVVDASYSLDSVKASEASCTTFIAISLPPAVILLSSQLFGHSIRSILVLPSGMRSHEIVRRAPEKIRSASTDIDGIDNISIAI
jgi:hypothetical protein